MINKNCFTSYCIRDKTALTLWKYVLDVKYKILINSVFIVLCEFCTGHYEQKFILQKKALKYTALFKHLC